MLVSLVVMMDHNPIHIKQLIREEAQRFREIRDNVPVCSDTIQHILNGVFEEEGVEFECM